MTSRVDGDDPDDENGEDTQASGIRAATPRLAPQKPAVAAAPVTTEPANGNVSDRTAFGPVATSDTPASEADFDTTKDSPAPDGPAADSAQDRGRSGGADATVVDGVPAFPADSIARPSWAPVSPSADVWTPGGFAQSAADAPSPTLPSSSPPPGSWSPGFSASSSAPSSSAPSSPAPSRTEAPAVSPAAFAWELPDAPPDSRSSTARSFLRTGTNAKGATASGTPAAGVGAGAGKTAPGQPAPGSAPKKASKRSGQRQAHLTVARVEPWSVMKFSFVVSLVAFVILFVAVSVLYGALAGLGVFDSLQRVVSSITSSQSSAGVNAAKWWSASRILGYTALLGSINIVLITAMSTIGAVVYNLTSRLVGGVEVTLRETE
ncbi:MAG TPA: DUF3566 domain-containing protein [Streptosporangiaceae bacterium]|nr:DUF3566 domain-containing protein [Streptosporangiaceae bacterium]